MERIPLHDHSDRNSGGELDRHGLVRGGVAGGTVGSGSPPSGGGGTSAHALDGPLHTNLGAYVKSTRGGEETVYPLGAMGTAATVDSVNGNWQYGTLDDDCTLTLADTTNATGNSIILEVIQDGTGGWALDLTTTGNIVNASDLEAAQVTTADTTSFLLLIQRDATNWYGFWAGGTTGPDLTGIDFLVGTASGDLSAEIVVGTSPGGELGGTWASPTVDATHSGSAHVTNLNGLSDVTITSPTTDDDLRYNGSQWVNDARKWEAVTDGEDVFVWEGDDLVHEWSV